MGDAVKLIAKGLNTSRVYEPVLTPDQLTTLETTRTPNRSTAIRCVSASQSRLCGLPWHLNMTLIFPSQLPELTRCPTSLRLSISILWHCRASGSSWPMTPAPAKPSMAGLLLKELEIRGLVKRTLIITPANLSFQWQREMKDKFRENFEVIRSDVLRANYGSNPWQDKNQVITSVSWVSRIEDAKESLLRSHWDLIIVDEAHKMSAASRDKTTLAYDLGAELSKMTDHYLLMTATPHKGDPEIFACFWNCSTATFMAT